MTKFNRGSGVSAHNKHVLNAFVLKYDLNQESTSLLHAVHDQVQQELLSTFNPSTKTGMSYDKKFQSFCRSKTISFFVDQWNLSQESKDLLFAAPPGAQIDIMGTFQPKHYSPGEDVNPLFASFVKRVVRTHNEGKADTSMLLAPGGKPSKKGSTFDFCRQWGLDRATRSTLEQSPRDVVEGVMADFAPRNTDPSFINEKFVAFLQSRIASAGKHVTVKSGRDPNVKDFLRKWGLAKDCGSTLEELPLGIRTSIMAEFGPRSGSDVTKNFFAFVKSRREPTVEHFIKRFELDSEAQAFLNNMEPEAQESVMNEFAPADMEFANPVFMSFAKGVLRRFAGVPIGGAIAPRGARKSSEVDEFCAKWELDQECNRRLLDLAIDARRSVMSDFEPKESIGKNLSALFTSFIRSREAQSNGRKIGKGASKGASKGSSKGTSKGASKGTGKGLHHEQNCAISKFVQQNALNSESSKFLKSLNPDDQNLVMVHFDGSRASGDVDQFFIKFCHKKAKRMRDGVEVRDRRVRPRVA